VRRTSRKALRARVRRERPQSQPARALALGDLEQTAADPAAGHVGVDVELLDPVVLEHEDPAQRVAVVVREPQLAVLDDV
jgi:hypothetical protein